MTFYQATLIEVLIIQLFVFSIWVKVLFDASKVRETGLASKKLVLTSIGLVLSSLAVTGIVSYRIYEMSGRGASDIAITGFYVLLAAAGFILMLAASLGENRRLLKLFLIVTLGWSLIAFLIANNITKGI